MAKTIGIPPIGSIVLWPGDKMPDSPEWLLCNGDTLLQDDYPELFQVIGKRFTSGAIKPTEFKLPNIETNTEGDPRHTHCLIRAK